MRLAFRLATALSIFLLSWSLWAGEEFELPKMKKPKPPAKRRQIVPSRIEAGGNERDIASRVVSHNLEQMLQDHYIKNPFLETTERLDSYFEHSLVKMGSRSKNQNLHQINFEIRSAESKARIKYRGFVEAHVTYNFVGQDVLFEMFKRVGKKTDLVYQHRDFQPHSYSDTVNLRWHW